MRSKLIKTSKTILKTVGLTTVSFAGLGFLMSSLFPTYKIEGISMLPSIEPGKVYSTVTFWDEISRHDIFTIDASLIESNGSVPSDVTYIKRIVGLPGDTLVFNTQSGQLVKINSKKIQQKLDRNIRVLSLTSKLEESKGATVVSHPYTVSFEGAEYKIYEADKETFRGDEKMKLYTDKLFDFSFLKEQSHGDLFATIKVPNGYYFSLSDNRTAGIDSRHFGLIPESGLKNKATLKEL